MQKLGWGVESLVFLVMMIVMWTYYVEMRRSRGTAESEQTKRQRQLRPRTPRDCQDCRTESLGEGLELRRTARAWSEVKSSRGRPKTHDTDGQACMDPRCEYYKDTDGKHHALRWDGQRGQGDGIPSVECGACGSKHTVRLGTPLYQLKTERERVLLATHLAMKGMDVAAISEVLGHSPETVTRWLKRSGIHSEELHEHEFKHLVVVHIQLDELVNKVRRLGRRVWVWTCGGHLIGPD